MTLVSESSAHHVGLLGHLATRPDHTVSYVPAHHYVVLLNYRDPIELVLILPVLGHVLLGLLRAAVTMILLCLNNMAAQHLRVFDLNLWIVEDVIVIINVFDDFNWLVLILLLWL